MTRTISLTVVITLAALTAGCAADSAAPSDEPHCRAADFAAPFSEVDPCSAESVLTAAVRTVFAYRPSEQLDQREAFRAARPLMSSAFAQRGEPAALVWAPIGVTQWQQWRIDATTVAVSARVSSDDHPADTATTASRVLAVQLEPRNQPPIRWAIYAHASRTTAVSAWVLSELEVLS
ncbi:hypothetical protein OIE68_45375 [Nocardia vinacea]|uniref:hypothetical protein n=1 Tax=Nocardia vinacea TaxID=96468 RepID=UPI002E114736|nr:hypothetical protein OIE68_45375 [Nocardia vinacea]